MNLTKEKHEQLRYLSAATNLRFVLMMNIRRPRPLPINHLTKNNCLISLQYVKYLY